MICGNCKKEISYTDYTEIRYHLDEKCLVHGGHHGHIIRFTLADTAWPQIFTLVNSWSLRTPLFVSS